MIELRKKWWIPVVLLLSILTLQLAWDFCLSEGVFDSRAKVTTERWVPEFPTGEVEEIEFSLFQQRCQNGEIVRVFESYTLGSATASFSCLGMSADGKKLYLSTQQINYKLAYSLAEVKGNQLVWEKTTKKSSLIALTSLVLALLVVVIGAVIGSLVIWGLYLVYERWRSGKKRVGE